MNIHQVAELTGLTARSIRYYIHCGLLQKPIGKGRATRYTLHHVQRLKRINELREQGWSIKTIFRAWESSTKRTEEYAQEMRGEWVKYPLTDDVELHVRKGTEKANRRFILAIAGLVKEELPEQR